MNKKRHAGDPRAIARDVLRAVRERDAYANLLLPPLLRDARMAAALPHVDRLLAGHSLATLQDLLGQMRE